MTFLELQLSVSLISFTTDFGRKSVSIAYKVSDLTILFRNMIQIFLFISTFGNFALIKWSFILDFYYFEMLQPEYLGKLSDVSDLNIKFLLNFSCNLKNCIKGDIKYQFFYQILILPFWVDFVLNAHEPVKSISLPFFNYNLFLIVNFPACHIAYQNYYYRRRSYLVLMFGYRVYLFYNDKDSRK